MRGNEKSRNENYRFKTIKNAAPETLQSGIIERKIPKQRKKRVLPAFAIVSLIFCINVV